MFGGAILLVSPFISMNLGGHAEGLQVVSAGHKVRLLHSGTHV